MVIGWIYYEQLFAWLSAPFAGAVEQARAEGRAGHAGPDRGRRPVRPADADRRDGRDRPVVAGLAVPAVAVHHPRPAPQRAPLGLRLRRRGHAPVPRRRRARLRGAAARPAGPARLHARQRREHRVGRPVPVVLPAHGAGLRRRLPACRSLLVLLNFAGVLPGRRLLSWWRWIILGVMVFAAVATPTGDPINLMLLAGPILLLVAIAVGICLLNDRRRARRRAADPDADDYDDLDDDEASPLDLEPSPVDAPSPIDEPRREALGGRGGLADRQPAGGRRTRSPSRQRRRPCPAAGAASPAGSSSPAPRATRRRSPAVPSAPTRVPSSPAAATARCTPCCRRWSGTPVPLGIVAGGSGDDIAAGLGFPTARRRRHRGRGIVASLDRPAGADRSTSGLARTADGVERYFLGVLSTGFDSSVNERANAMTRLGGQRYNVAIARELASFRPLDYDVVVDGVRERAPGMLVVRRQRLALRRRHARLPGRRARRRPARRHLAGRRVEADVPAGVPVRLPGHPRRAPGGAHLPRPRRCASPRRARSPTPTANASARCPSTSRSGPAPCACCPADLTGTP